MYKKLYYFQIVWEACAVLGLFLLFVEGHYINLECQANPGFLCGIQGLGHIFMYVASMILLFVVYSISLIAGGVFKKIDSLKTPDEVIEIRFARSKVLFFPKVMLVIATILIVLWFILENIG